MKPILALSLVSTLLFLTGCAGYHDGSIHDPGFKTIFIENFKSEVDEPTLENLVTTMIIKELQNDGFIEVTHRKNADVIVQGHITSFKTSPVRFSRGNKLTPTEVTLTLGVTYTLTKRGETKSYRKGQASGTARFFIGNDLQGDKQQGVPRSKQLLKIDENGASSSGETKDDGGGPPRSRQLR